MEMKAVRGWTWALLGVLTAYQIAMYSWVMRTYMHWSVVFMPWLLHQPGYRLYVNAISQHAPGSYWLGALLYKLIPDPVVRVRLSMILLVVLCTALIFALARKWWGEAAGLLAAAWYVIWAPVIMDHLMYYDILVGTLAVAALFVWHRASPSSLWRPFVAGLLVGLSILAKQQGLAVAGVYVIWRLLAGAQWRSTIRDIVAFAFSVVLPPGIVLGLFAIQNRLADALYWLWFYNVNPDYVEATAQGIGPNEVVLIAGWLILVPLFAAFEIPKRSSWGREGILLLGLLIALMAPAYPRYGRFHLSGAVPVAALVSAGAWFLAWPFVQGGRRFIRSGLRLYLAGAALVLGVALALPTYYRIKLGPRDSEYGELVPLAAWMAERVETSPGMRVLILPDIDPTSNFYAIGNYLPPVLWIPTYSWFADVPGMSERMRWAVDEQRPEYILVVEKWRTEIPDALLALWAPTTTR
jgi:hypothetical protein